MKNNYYEILGVTPDSDMCEIKSAYRTLARKYHPDMTGGNINKFKEINEAYETLSNERKRMQYNMLFGFYKKAAAPPPPRQETPPPRKEPEQPKTSPKKEKVMPQNGSDLTAEVSITMSEAKYGTSKVVNILHTELCPKCKGRKFINGSHCSECNGTGEKSRRRKLTVTVPPDIKNETRLRIKGEGNVGKNGGQNGDLFLVIKIESNKNVRYEGKTVHYDVPLEPHEAVLGTSVSLKTLEGNILIKIPPRTKSGQKFRIQQNVRGDVFEILVTVHIEIPPYLSHDEIKLYEKLKKMSNGSLRENFINE